MFAESYFALTVLHNILQTEGRGGRKLVHRYGVKFDREGGGRDNRRSSTIQIPGADAVTVRR